MVKTFIIFFLSFVFFLCISEADLEDVTRSELAELQYDDYSIIALW